VCSPIVGWLGGKARRRRRDPSRHSTIQSTANLSASGGWWPDDDFRGAIRIADDLQILWGGGECCLRPISCC
jgi:hypothetical protein